MQPYGTSSQSAWVQVETLSKTWPNGVEVANRCCDRGETTEAKRSSKMCVRLALTHTSVVFVNSKCFEGQSLHSRFYRYPSWVLGILLPFF